jgi:hypothetical protein
MNGGVPISSIVVSGSVNYILCTSQLSSYVLLGKLPLRDLEAL